MADTKISNLTELTSPASDDELVIVDTDAGETKRISRINLLEERGNWTMTVTPATSGSVTLASNKDECAYTKVGRVVHVQGQIQVSSISSPSGDLQFSLPFTVANLVNVAGHVSGSTAVQNLNFTADYLVASPDEGDAYFQIFEVIDNSGFDRLEGADMGGNEYFRFSFSYIAA